jgi:lipoprotein-releasing system permease protein
MKDWLPFEWIVGLRFLREGRMQTLFIVGGISVGVAVIVFMSALLAGMQANFIRRVLNTQAHIVLVPKPEATRALRRDGSEIEAAIIQQPTQRIRAIDQWQKIMETVGNMRDVVEISPMASGSALAVRGEVSRAINLAGIDTGKYYRIVKLPDNLVLGHARLGGTDIVIGKELASDLGLTVGDKLRIGTAAGGDAIQTVIGIFDVGNRGANQRNTYVTLRTAQSLLGMTGGVTSIDVTVKDIYAAEDIARRIGMLTGVEADSWIQNNAQFFAAVQAQTTANISIRFFVGLSVAFGIASVLVVSVVQRSKEIGILRATGTTRGQILRVFLLQGAILGLIGSGVGSAAGAFAISLWHSYARNADGTPMFLLVIEPALFIASAVLATITGLLAAVAPAVRASRLDPVVAIRG